MSRRVQWLRSGARSLRWALAALACAACARPAERELARGNEAAAAGRLDEARAAYEAAAGLDPSSARAQALVGNARWSSGDRAGAAQAWQAARALEPRHPLATRGLALAALEAHDAGAALEELGQLEGPPGPEVRLLRARSLLARGAPGDAEQALADAEAAAAANPGAAEPGYLVGSAQVALRRFADAQTTFEQLQKAQAKSPLGAYGLARLAAAQSRSTDTLLYLKQARAVAGPAWSPDLVGSDPAFTFLAESPDFRELLGR